MQSAGYSTLSLTAWPRDYYDRERAGLRRLLYALPADQRLARYAEVAKCWATVRSRRVRLTDSTARLGVAEWPEDTPESDGGPSGYYEPQAFDQDSPRRAA
jgi:hypothetical protein